MRLKSWIAIGILLLAIIVGIVVAISVSSGETAENEQLENQFDAKVTEVQKEYIMVEALEGQDIAGEVHVWVGNLSDMPELNSGDAVRITHDGKMTMSLPPQMSAIKLDSIKK